MDQDGNSKADGSATTSVIEGTHAGEVCCIYGTNAGRITSTTNAVQKALHHVHLGSLRPTVSNG